MRYAFIRAHQGEYAITRMCHVLEASKAGYYAWRKRAPGERARTNRQLKMEIRAAYVESRKTYGSPRVHADLGAQGISCSLGRVERLMREEGLQARKRRRFQVTTDSQHRSRPRRMCWNGALRHGRSGRPIASGLRILPISRRARAGSFGCGP